MPDHLCNLLQNGISTGQVNHHDLQANEKKMIIDALMETGWNQSRAAKMLNITRNTLRYRIKKFDIQA
jgi:two-component system response regulator HydG